MKTKDILYRNLFIGIFFILGGMLWLSLYYENLLGKLLSGFFIIFGIFISINSYRKWKRGEELEAPTDERSELNLLRASRAGFLFLYLSISLLFALFGLRLINEIIFTALMGPVFAVSSVLYVLSFYRY